MTKEASGFADGAHMPVPSGSQALGSHILNTLSGLLARLKHLILIPIIFLIWELGVRLHWIDGNILPAPSATIRALIDLAEAGYLWRDVEASVLRVTIGFGLAAVAAISLGLALGIWRSAAAYILPIIELLRPISVLAWIPLAILWFGLGDHSAWFIIFLGSFFPIFTNTYLGARSVALIHLQVAQCFGAGRWLFLRRVMFPSALPYIIAGLRVGLGVGWTCVIAAELIAATSGLGYMIQLARTMIETEKVMAGMIVIGVIGFVMNSGMHWLERRFIRWAPDHH
ncbi:ABC transporter permease [Bradyrhizobium canariense]|uniref:NitT/TauT family transport system permease protein/sulfonate transport system permease protein n=1 Tax=Bradyrhizobium canariense TaxID=255045 RepID=A0A1H1YNI2_9BRAD|nr:ABC transporter permease [Bradyrhizobium canariense]SDT23028.1 NitT/TauT family transport system permease protein/sulfonate transport system permease protein [Bradyrhizobium canariense]